MLEAIGRYTIEEEVGVGASSTVYRAYDRDRQRVVALKLLHPELIGPDVEDPVHLLRVGAEGASVLTHPNLSKVVDVGTFEGMYFVCTEFVEGISAFEMVSRFGVLPLPAAARVALDVLSALQLAHASGVLHGDVKLENVMLRDDGQVVLTDFGVADEGLARAASVTAAPEKILGHPCGAPTDIYGVAIVFFEVLTGEAAFPMEEGEDPWEVARRRVEEPPPRIDRHLELCPPELQDLLARGLARDPEARYSSANDFSRQLEVLLARLELPVPERFSMRTLERDLEDWRARTRKAFRDFRDRPTEVEAPSKAAAIRSGSGWAPLMIPVCTLGALLFLFVFRLGYLSISAVPHGAYVYELPVGEADLATGRALGPAPITFRRTVSGVRNYVLVWNDGVSEQTRMVPEVEVPVRGHLQITAGLRGPPAKRVTRVLPDLKGMLERLVARLSGRGYDHQAAEVDPEGDKLLQQRKLAEAAEVYKARIGEDHARARKAADRLVEAALFHRRKDAEWAQRALELALGFDSDHKFARAVLGDLLYERGVPGALTHLRRAAILHFASPPAGLSDDPYAALNEVRRRRKQDPLDDNLRAWEAILVAKVGDPKEAAIRLRELAHHMGWTSRFR